MATPGKQKDDRPVEVILADALRKATGLRPKVEYEFHPYRKWRIDVAFIPRKIAIEIDGSFHLRHAAHRRDCEKANAAICMGWTVFRYPAAAITTKSRLALVVEQITRYIRGEVDKWADSEVLTTPKRER